MNLVLAPGVLEEMIAHARASQPEECCGLLVGRNGIGERLVPMTNALRSATAYEMDPAALIGARRSLRDSGEDIAAIYHSHPRGPSHPSSTDAQRASYPNAAHIIVSLETPESPVVRGFLIVDGEAAEIDVHAIV